MTPRLVLASSSPRRAELLRQIGLSFEVAAPQVDETTDLPDHPKERVFEIARRKAQAVAQTVEEGWIVAADTIVVQGGEPIGKPTDAEHARRILRRLAGSRHKVLTAVVVVRMPEGEYRADVAQTGVLFTPLSDAQIAEYVATGEPLDKAGAYGIQGLAGAYVRDVHGDPSNVRGLPLALTVALLAEAGYPLPGSLKPEPADALAQAEPPKEAP
ncbi:MAG TPA: Maf family protein [Candidatus Thermoplasmatota archaeon]|nr:Maf family protein [Candidatus Thermoplasmatota archaeon]